MANYNKVILMGNLTRDPQLSYTANNTAIAEFGLAVNRKRKGADGQMKEEAMFIDCKVFGKRAETFSQYMAKGRPVLIEGRLEFRQWQTPGGPETLQAWRRRRELPVPSAATVPKAAAPARPAAGPAAGPGVRGGCGPELRGPRAGRPRRRHSVLAEPSRRTT